MTRAEAGATSDAKPGAGQGGSGRRARTVALLGNPNVGKSTLFNRLTTSRARTSNFPGTTQEALVGEVATRSDERDAGPADTLIDLPGTYGLHLRTPESEICRSVLDGRLAPVGRDPVEPDVLVIVADATNLVRNLVLVGQALQRQTPTVVAVNMNDAAKRRGVHIDAEQLSDSLGVPVVLTCARTGEGVEDLRRALARAATPNRTAPADQDALERWADDVYTAAASAPETDDHDRLTDRLDRAFTHPLVGVSMFVAIMTGLFYVIFSLAAYPMEWIDAIFASLGGVVSSALPAGALRDMLTDGVIAGVGATVIFLPQICLLFFLLSLLEQSGYLARAAFVVDRLLRPFGLSGHAFVPLLSSHACALPGIIAARTIPDRRDRLATILVAPFMSCTARIPVYVLLTVLLFPGSPAMQAVAFTGCYVVGALAGLLSAMIARRSILKGASRPMALELPAYRVPPLGVALRSAGERGWMFLKKAGVLIMSVSIVLWWLNTYPQAEPPAEAQSLRAQATMLESSEPERAEALYAQAETVSSRHAAQSSFLGRVGEAAQPIFAPLGADRQLTIGILASFAAREVFVSTMAVQVVGTEDAEDPEVLDALASAKRDNGSLLFDTPTAWALLIYYILAMQCLPTLVVTAREAGSWKWAALQLGWMQVLAYGGGAIAFAAATFLTSGGA
jgi:ferrous iron transport protein B